MLKFYFQASNQRNAQINIVKIGMYKVLTCQMSVKGNLVLQMNFGEIFQGRNIRMRDEDTR